MSETNTPSNEPAKPRALSPREEAMEAVANNRRADFTKETGIAIEHTPVGLSGGGDDEDGSDAAAEAERARLQAIADGKAGAGGEDDEQQRLQAAQQADADAQAQQAAADAEAATARAQAAAGIDPKGTYKLKINGSERDVSGEELLRRAQKDISADERLTEASRLMREAEALQQELQQAAQQRATASPAAPAQPSEATKNFTDAMFAGDQEKAAQAFNEAVAAAVKQAREDAKGRSDATPINPAQIAATVRQQIAVESALERSQATYPELYADPDINAVAATRIERMQKEGTPFVQALETVQGDFAKKFGWKPKLKTVPTPQTDRRNEKLATKEGLDNVSGGPQVKQGSQEPAQTTVHDTIAEMAKARGQMSVS